MRPALENRRSEATEVAGIVNNALAALLRIGNNAAFCFHHSKISVCKGSGLGNAQKFASSPCKLIIKILFSFTLIAAENCRSADFWEIASAHLIDGPKIES